ncbi:DUF4335 domain-containing protein [Thermosynechococcus sp. JY1334]|uniref:DUF4335 domain-containing protein n=1 Tax=unclassified Thermosynechococcus TaxID=2622553 RepID=UPI0026715A75|nr:MULTISPECIES: DUF4335 domain-containing protein [unclassified Thermosynechococcus]MDR7897298.1 DUF4335 domain-containing protein [Thermosynechococcus sp. JY1332]MDR7904701.1 DUF4335 domain-containing protein [Thermosynechococcus sp. JY1334]MDR7992527.1 DUF4335 domain-containing protein [Thermosynechococcus sp. TG252]WKT86931.1 DUF4335 domain-containing protein [Thermosynechococcus sp. JY1339]WNC55874.1 DUF4335 domain-containing protein [Thermosynechococcus sp. JY1331]
MSTTLSYSQPTCQLDVAAEFLPFSQKRRRAPVRSLHFTLAVGEKLCFEGNDRQLYQLKTLVNEYIEAFLSHHQTPTEVTAEGFVLRSRSPLEHELHLPDGRVILLQLTELYDLVTVLDDWSAVMEPLPELVERAQSIVAQIPIWAKSAAVAVGVVAAFTLVTQRWLIPPASMVVTSSEATREEPNLPPLAMPSPLPELPEPAETPQLAPLPSPPPAAPETSTLVPLPSPPEMPPPAIVPPPPPVPQEAPPPQPPDQNNVVVQAPAGRAPASIEPAPMITPPAETTPVPATTLREVKTYFQDRWRPPASLDTSLEYRIVLNPDGTLAQALPLNGAAVRFIDRTPIPLQQSPLASPLGGDRPILLRLVLMPSGSVQVFGEN